MTDSTQQVHSRLDELIAATRAALGDTLVSAILFGSAAEGRLRTTSDVNLLLILSRFDPPRIDALRGPLRMAQDEYRLAAMFVLESELPQAAEAFAVKFSDILNRRRVLHGGDPFTRLAIPREATLRRLRQVFLNLLLRLRHAYALHAQQDTRAAQVVAQSAGPLRAAAATLLTMRGEAALPPKEALAKVVAEWNDPAMTALLYEMSAAREVGLAEGQGEKALLHLVMLTERLLGEANALA